MHTKNLMFAQATTRHSTQRTALHACEGEEAVRPTFPVPTFPVPTFPVPTFPVPTFPVTSRPNAGPDGVRMKLLTGLNGLGKTLGRVCPQGCDARR